MRVAICDDNIDDIKAVEHELELFMQHYGDMLSLDVYKYYDGVELLFAVVGGRRYEVIILDVQMPGMDGEECARRINELYTPIYIFMTSIPRLVTKAAHMSPFSIVAKPIESRVFQMELLFTFKEYTMTQYYFPSDTFSVRYSEIYYIESLGKRYIIHAKSGNYQFVGSLVNIQSILDKNGFYRCHRSFLVNMFTVTSWEDKDAIMANGDRVPIAEANIKEFKSIITRIAARSYLPGE